MSAVSNPDLASAFWNEAYVEPGVPRSHYRVVLRALDEVDPVALAERVERRIQNAGVTFSERPFTVCPIPRLIAPEEFSALSAALAQRVRALSEFVADAYGLRRIVAAGLMPAAVIDGAEGYEPELLGRWPETHAPLGVVGLDVVRDRSGELRVLEDNSRTPSGYAYAIAAREALIGALAESGAGATADLPAPAPVEPEVVAALAGSVDDAAAAVGVGGCSGDSGHPVAIVLTDGPGSSAHFEHVVAARWLRAPLVTAAQLDRRGDELWLSAEADRPAHRVDVVYRRTDSERLRSSDGGLTPIAERLLQPWLAGRIAIVNGFGTGVADDKLVHAYVEAMIRFYLGEEPLIRSVETLDLNDSENLERVLADPRSYVIKPRHGHGGHGVVVCAHADGVDVRRVQQRLRQTDVRRALRRAATRAAVVTPRFGRRAHRPAAHRSAAVRVCHPQLGHRDARSTNPSGARRGRPDCQLFPGWRREGHVGTSVSDRSASTQAQWPEWNTDVEPYSVGVEEETMLLDPANGWSLAQRIEDVLPALPDSLAGYVSAETHQAAIELRTDPHDSVQATIAQLGELRSELAAVLSRMGLAVASAGTHPLAEWTETEVSSASRYQLIHRTMRDLAMREPTFALHVHVGVPDPERAIELYNRLRVHLPLLLALSGNSPYWRGRDAGFVSSRTILFQAFPRTGMPRRYASYGEWVDAVDLLVRAGALPEPTFIWWDVRPQPRFGTVELRIMDAQTRRGETAALLALVQSIARLELEEGYVAEHIIRSEEVLAENRFIATRDGVDARLIDTTEEALRPLRTLLAELLDAARPHAEVLGCAGELDEVIGLAAVPGAARQRTYPADDEGLRRLVAALAGAFTD